MKVYRIVYDGQARIVEAQGFGDAVEVWRDGMAVDWGGEAEGNEEPDSVELISEDRVIREMRSADITEALTPAEAWAMSPETMRLTRWDLLALLRKAYAQGNETVNRDDQMMCFYCDEVKPYGSAHDDEVQHLPECFYLELRRLFPCRHHPDPEMTALQMQTAVSDARGEEP